MSDEIKEENRSPDPSINPEKVSASEWLAAEMKEKLKELSNKCTSYIAERNAFIKAGEDIKALKKTFGLINKNLRQEDIWNKWDSVIHYGLLESISNDESEGELSMHELYEHFVNELVQIASASSKLRYGTREKLKFSRDMGIRPMFPDSPQGYSWKVRPRLSWPSFEEERSNIDRARLQAPKKTIAKLAEEILKDKKMGLQTTELKQKIIETGRPIETNTLITALNRAKSKFKRNDNKKWVLIDESEARQDALHIFEGKS